MRLMTAPVLFAIGLALPAAAATPQQFDLVCQGKSSTVSADIKPIESTDDARFSVDLAQKVWWRHQAGATPRPKPIADARGDMLKLSDEKGPQGENRIEIDTQSGAYNARLRVHTGITPDIIATTKGRCTLAPLTPGVL